MDDPFKRPGVDVHHGRGVLIRFTFDGALWTRQAFQDGRPKGELSGHMLRDFWEELPARWYREQAVRIDPYGAAAQGLTV
jgi:hypothetical protein